MFVQHYCAPSSRFKRNEPGTRLDFSLPSKSNFIFESPRSYQVQTGEISTHSVFILKNSTVEVSPTKAHVTHYMTYPSAELRNHCHNYFLSWWRYQQQNRSENWIMGLHKFCLHFGVDTFINSQNISFIPYHLISTFNVYFDFYVGFANNVTNGVAKCALPGKMMQRSPIYF